MARMNKSQQQAIHQFAAALASKGFKTQVQDDGAIRLILSSKELMSLRLDFENNLVKVRSHTKVKGEWVHSAVRAAQNVRYFYRIMRQKGAPISGFAA